MCVRKSTTFITRIRYRSVRLQMLPVLQHERSSSTEHCLLMRINTLEDREVTTNNHHIPSKLYTPQAIEEQQIYINYTPLLLYLLTRDANAIVAHIALLRTISSGHLILHVSFGLMRPMRRLRIVFSTITLLLIRVRRMCSMRLRYDIYRYI